MMVWLKIDWWAWLVPENGMLVRLIAENRLVGVAVTLKYTGGRSWCLKIDCWCE